MAEYTLTLLLFNMRTGHTEKHELILHSPTHKGGSYIATVSHRLYHRLKAHFTTDPFTTPFTKSHGHYILHGYVKTNEELRIPVKFEQTRRQV